jgi:hypothetical protein
MNIIGEVKSGDQKPIANAKVSLRAPANGQLVGDTYTGDEGKFDLNYDHKTSGYQVEFEVSKDGFISKKFRHSIEEDRIAKSAKQEGDQEYTLPMAFVLEGGKIIVAGRVVDPNGNSLGGVKVAISSGHTLIVEVPTKDDGSFHAEVESSRAGTKLKLEARHDDLTGKTEIQLTPEGEKDLVLQLIDPVPAWFKWIISHAKWITTGLVALLVMATLILLVVRSCNHRKMPPLVGKSLTEATQVLNRKHLVLSDITYTTNDATPPNTVQDQSPPPGDSIDRDTEIALLITEHTRTITVPPVVDLKLTNAISKLKELHFSIDSTAMMTTNKAKNGIVLSQKPPAGQIAIVGTLVKLEYGETNNVNPAKPFKSHWWDPLHIFNKGPGH